MARFILRYQGAGSHSESDLARALARRNAKVIDRTSRMLLVEGSDDALHEEFGNDPDWLITRERSIDPPDPKLRIEKH